MENDKSLPGGENLDPTLDHLKSEDDCIHKDFMILRSAFSRKIDLKETIRQSLVKNPVLPHGALKT